jgi:mannose-1-phosphate guanylyltransferase
MNVIIFAGGQGTRLWPASRANQPKQFLKLVGNKTLLEQTFERLKAKFKPSQVFIATSSEYAPFIKKQLPKIPATNFSLEPSRRNRGPALGLAVLIMQQQSKDDVFATAWSDDHIANPKLYLQTLSLAGRLTKQQPDKIFAIGAKPNAASPAFCYIQCGKILAGVNNLYTVKKFTDKPKVATAKKFLRSGNYLWNTGYFVSTGTNILNLYKKYYPKSYRILMELKPWIGTDQQTKMIKKYYHRLESFDFEEILRKQPKELSVIAAEFGWADVGRWAVIKDIQSGMKDNLLIGNVVAHNTTGSLIYNYDPKQLVATLHTDSLVIVNTPEALLVANKDSTEELKALIKILEQDKHLKKFL